MYQKVMLFATFLVKKDTSTEKSIIAKPHFDTPYLNPVRVYKRLLLKNVTCYPIQANHVLLFGQFLAGNDTWSRASNRIGGGLLVANRDKSGAIDVI